jgi:hypothetical protein
MVITTLEFIVYSIVMLIAGFAIGVRLTREDDDENDI